MEPDLLKRARRARGLSQARLAEKLGTSQAYVSLLESGRRSPSDALARRLGDVLDLSPAARPVRVAPAGLRGFDADRAARELGALGYPGFRYLVPKPRKRGVRNPLEVLLRALATKRVDPRVLEALPWLLLRFPDLDTAQAVRLAHRENLQNRLGFVVALARAAAERHAEHRHCVPGLDRMLEALERFRLANEDDLGRRFRSDRFNEWVRERRTAAAQHWNVLTDLTAEHLAHVG